MLKKIIIFFLIFFVGLPLILLLALIYKFDSVARKMSPQETKLLFDNIYSIYNRPVNMFFIKNGDNFILIDTGTGVNLTEKELKKLNIDPLKVTDVFLTHTDYDHVGSVKLYKNARFYISKEEEQMINGKIHRKFFYDNKLNCNYELLVDNQEIIISNYKVKCLLTQGHTIGSMSYLINDIYLFTGDTLSLFNEKVNIYFNFFNYDTELQRKSITKLSKLNGVKYLITAHFGFISDFKKAFSEWKEQ